MSKEMKFDRHRFLCGTAVMAVAAVELRINSADAESGENKTTGTTANKPGTITFNKGSIGHNLPQEAPQAFAKAVIEVDGASK